MWSALNFELRPEEPRRLRRHAMPTASPACEARPASVSALCIRPTRATASPDCSISPREHSYTQRDVGARNEWYMKNKHTIRILTLTSILALSACTTVVEERKPVTTSTTTTEETVSRNPIHESTTTQTTRTQTR